MSEIVIRGNNETPGRLPYMASYWGDYVELRPAFTVECNLSGGERGQCKSMSFGSRLRFIAALNKLAKTPRFLITLTYEDDTCGGLLPTPTSDSYQDEKCLNLASTDSCSLPIDLRPLKTHLRAFLQFLRRERLEAAWWLEFTERGRPHWHLFLLDVPLTEWAIFKRNGQDTEVCLDMFFGRRVADAWIRIANQKTETFHRGGIIEKLRFSDSAVRYAAKEASKRAQKSGGQEVLTGRTWFIPQGWIRKEPQKRELVLLPGPPKFKRVFQASLGIECLETPIQWMENVPRGTNVEPKPLAPPGKTPFAKSIRASS